eukprot:5837678-Prymnesium_polylepis.1
MVNRTSAARSSAVSDVNVFASWRALRRAVFTITPPGASFACFVMSGDSASSRGTTGSVAGNMPASGARRSPSSRCKSRARWAKPAAIVEEGGSAGIFSFAALRGEYWCMSPVAVTLKS